MTELSFWGASVTYGALGREVAATGGTWSPYTVVYAPDGAKLGLMTSGGDMDVDIPLPGGGAAVYGGGVLAYYRHADWLGSAALSTAADGTLRSSNHYTPFGFSETGSGGNGYDSFTGAKQWIDATHTGGQYDFMYREYNPEQGRWWTPDPAGVAAVDPDNPQTWNRYGYVGGTPLEATDPLGLSGYTFTSDVWAPFWNSNALWGLFGVGGDGPKPGCYVENKSPNGGKGHVVAAGYHSGERPRVTYVDGPDCGAQSRGGGGGAAVSRLPGNGDTAKLGDWYFKGLTCSLGLAEANKGYAAVGGAEAAWPVLQAAAAAHGISPALLAAVAVRESAFRNVDEVDGKGVGAGVFQLTVSRASGVTMAEANSLPWAANRAAGMLAGNAAYVAGRFPWFKTQDVIEATAAIYNMGPGSHGQNLTGNPATIDSGTAGGDYGLTVFEMMSCFQ